MRRFAPIILVALIAPGVVLLTTTGRRQATPETPSTARLFPDLAGGELRKAIHDYAAAGQTTDLAGYALGVKAVALFSGIVTVDFVAMLSFLFTQEIP